MKKIVKKTQLQELEERMTQLEVLLVQLAQDLQAAGHNLTLIRKWITAQEALKEKGRIVLSHDTTVN